VDSAPSGEASASGLQNMNELDVHILNFDLVITAAIPFAALAVLFRSSFILTSVRHRLFFFFFVLQT